MSKRNTTTQPTTDQVKAPWTGWKPARESSRFYGAGTTFELAEEHVSTLRREFWRNGKRLTAEQAAFVESMSAAADNTIHGLMYGLNGLGEVLSVAVRNPEDGPSEEALASIGWMMQTITNVMIGAEELRVAAVHLSALQRGQADTEDAA